MLLLRLSAAHVAVYVQNQLGPWDLARFLVCRLSLQDSVRDLATLSRGQVNSQSGLQR